MHGETVKFYIKVSNTEGFPLHYIATKLHKFRPL